jgi:hypothetical protein
MRFNRPFRSVVLTACATAAVLAGAPVQSHEVHFTGKATGVNATLTAAGAKKTLVLADVLMACTGTAREETVSTISNPQPLGVSARTVRGYTIGRDDVAATNAGIEELHMNLADGFRVDATALQSNAESRCDQSTLKVSATGSANVGSLFINGEGRTLTGEPNQTFEVPGLGKVIVNEQLRPSSREIIVNAMHVIVADPNYPANGDLVFAHSRAKVTCSH